METLILYRGLPGAGKSAFACRDLDIPASELNYLVEMNEFFHYNLKNTYEFNEELLPAAHGWCQGETRKAISCMQDVYDKVGVANTFTQAWEMEPYVQIANEFKAALVIVDLFDAGLNDSELAERCKKHRVPVEVITMMRERWEKVTLVCTDQVYSLCLDMPATTVSGK